jgi:hypothetical protein
MRKLKGVQAIPPHRDTISRLCRRQIAPVPNYDGIEEMLVEMVDIFEHAILK